MENATPETSLAKRFCTTTAMAGSKGSMFIRALYSSTR